MAENIARNNGTASAKWKSRFCAVFRGIKSDAGGVFTGFGNPEGIESFSPGLADSERPALGDLTQQRCGRRSRQIPL